MRVVDLNELFEYDIWATERILDAAEKLEGSAYDQFIAAKGHGVGSARDLIVHVADAQRFWIGRLTDDPVPMADKERFNDIGEIRSHCAESNSRLRDWINATGDDEIETVWEFSLAPDRPVRRVRRDRLMTHVALHGGHHRAEASELLTAAGSAPEPVDMMIFYRARDGG